MIHISDKSKCCGCEACVQVCPKSCISFSQDTEGFFYPEVDPALCIDCGACENVCPEINQSTPIQPLHFFAAKNQDETIRMESSSGGIFTLLAESIICEGGVVFGAKFNRKWEVVHDYTETIEGIAAFRTSKYVQSRIGNSFLDAKRFLKEGRKILFTGTSCQIAALKLFLRRDYDNLYTIDVICHGVPSPKVWIQYLQAIKKSNDIGINSISFRDKRMGWKKYSIVVSFAKDDIHNTISFSHIHRNNPYMKSFLNNINLRPSCFQCPAKGGRSGSDITLGDFWGVDRQMPDFDDDKGISLVIINNRRGSAIFETLSTESIEVKMNTALLYNSPYFNSVKPHPNRSKFFSRLGRENVDVINLMESLSLQPNSVKVRNKIKKIINKVFRYFYN